MATCHYWQLGLSASPFQGTAYVRYCARDAARVAADYLRRLAADAASNDPQGSGAVREDVEAWWIDHASSGSIVVGIADAKLSRWRRG